MRRNSRLLSEDEVEAELRRHGKIRGPLKSQRIRLSNGSTMSVGAYVQLKKRGSNHVTHWKKSSTCTGTLRQTLDAQVHSIEYVNCKDCLAEHKVWKDLQAQKARDLQFKRDMLSGRLRKADRDWW